MLTFIKRKIIWTYFKQHRKSFFILSCSMLFSNREHGGRWACSLQFYFIFQIIDSYMLTLLRKSEVSIIPKGTNSVSKGDNEVDMSNTYCHHHYSQYNIIFPVPKALGRIIKCIIFQKYVLLISTSLSPFDTELVPLVALVYFTHVFDPSVCSSVIRLLSPE
jgi:hypothetical protein